MEKIRIRKELYSEDMIKECILAYRGYAKMTYKGDGEYWTLCFENCKYGEERTSKEFENYLIGLENQCHRES